MTTFRDLSSQTPGDRMVREALAISRILNEPKNINLGQQPTPQIPANIPQIRRQQPLLSPLLNDHLHYQK